MNTTSEINFYLFNLIILQLVKFNEFEVALKQLSDLASSLPQDACLTVNDTLPTNETSELTTDEDTVPDLPKKVLKNIVLWDFFMLQFGKK